jgi:hypothetical protein
MDGYRRLLWLLFLVSLTAASGASCPQMVRQITTPRPRALLPSPTLEQVIAVVNGNSSRIQSFASNYATITVAGYPTLRASLAMERPRRFRLLAETTLGGPEVDLGSNDELFWFWMRHDPQKAVYYCRHDQFAQSNARQLVPIAPADLAEALGLVEFDPSLPHQGPTTRSDGRLEVRTIRETDLGPSTRVTVVDPVTGWVLEQQTLDAAGQLVLSVVAGEHRIDPLSGLVMPKVVSIQCPPTRFAMTVNLGNVEINTLSADRAPLWVMPPYPGTTRVDLADPNVRFSQTGRSSRFSR